MTNHEKSVWTGRVGGYLSGKTRATRAAEYSARVRWAFEAILRANPQASLQAIADSLNLHGIRGRHGGLWHKATVRAYLVRMGLRDSDRMPHVYLQAA